VLRLKTREHNDGATDLERAVERNPLLSEAEVDKLTDLLELAAHEVAGFESELDQREESGASRAPAEPRQYRLEDIVGKSGPMLEVFRLLEKVSLSASTVLVTGESGTGKELVARVIHYNGPRMDKPFVVRDLGVSRSNLVLKIDKPGLSSVG